MGLDSRGTSSPRQSECRPVGPGCMKPPRLERWNGSAWMHGIVRPGWIIRSVSEVRPKLLRRSGLFMPIIHLRYLCFELSKFRSPISFLSNDFFAPHFLSAWYSGIQVNSIRVSSHQPLTLNSCHHRTTLYRSRQRAGRSHLACANRVGTRRSSS